MVALVVECTASPTKPPESCLRGYCTFTLKLLRAGDSAANGGSRSGAGTSAAEPCGLCGASPQLLPYEALPCRHHFCYYCLRSNTEADPGFQCPCCNVRVAAMRRQQEAITR